MFFKLVNFFAKKIKTLLFGVLKYIAKKVVILLIIGLAVVFAFSEIKLWIKNESEKMIKQTFSTEVKKVYPSPKKIKEKLNAEIFEKDLSILKKELDRLEKDFREKQIKNAILRLRVIENKFKEVKERLFVEKNSMVNIEKLNEITEKVRQMKNDIYKDYSAKFYKDNQD